MTANTVNGNRNAAGPGRGVGTSFSGLFPVAPTPFDKSGGLDLEGMRRVLDCMIDQGSDGICILANYSEQFVLSDDERSTLARLSLEHVAGRVPVMVTCSHFSTRIASSRARQAAEAGAAMVMVMPPYHGVGLQAGEAAMTDHFRAVADASGLPLMVQDAPLSGVVLSPSYLAELASEVPLARYSKIEVANSAAKIRTLLELSSDAIPFDGEEAITMMADLDAGARGTMCSALLPDLLLPVFREHAAGRRQSAAEAYARVLPLVNYENRQCGLRAAKAVMKEGGVIRSDHVRHPLLPLHPDTRRGLLELAGPLSPLALTWGR